MDVGLWETMAVLPVVDMLGRSVVVCRSVVERTVKSFGRTVKLTVLVELPSPSTAH